MRKVETKEKLSPDGEIKIPAEIREKLNLKSGEEVELAFEGDKIILRPIRQREKLKINREILDRLAKDEEFFEPERA